MPSRTSRYGHAVQPNMTPMIDVVFLLIIFFLVSSHLARQETQLELDLPRADSGEPDTSASPRVTVNVLPSGEIRLGASLATAEQIRQRLAFELQQAGGRLEVRIRSDRHVPYRTIAPILTACAKAGVWNVSLSVISPASAPTR